ncbi:MAG: hypothetical protein RJA61_177 [Candidatus Parcubacteria bacterium]|jgi:hypothetical protein
MRLGFVFWVVLHLRKGHDHIDMDSPDVLTVTTRTP